MHPLPNIKSRGAHFCRYGSVFDTTALCFDWLLKHQFQQISSSFGDQYHSAYYKGYQSAINVLLLFLYKASLGMVKSIPDTVVPSSETRIGSPGYLPAPTPARPFLLTRIPCGWSSRCSTSSGLSFVLSWCFSHLYSFSIFLRPRRSFRPTRALTSGTPRCLQSRESASLWISQSSQKITCFLVTSTWSCSFFRS